MSLSIPVASADKQERLRQASARYRAKNLDKCRAANTKWHVANPDRARERNAKWHEVNRERARVRKATWRAANQEMANASYAKWHNARSASDPMFRLRCRIRILIATSIKGKGYTKKSHTHEILGCDYPFFKAYIEARFLPGMSWENRSLWHLDHIVPVSSANTEGQLMKLNYYTNFRPLWAADNIRKGNKVNTQLTLLAA